MAPLEVCCRFRAWAIARRNSEEARVLWERHGTHLAYEDYCKGLTLSQHRMNDLVREMGRHLYKTYLVDGYRLRLVIERDGCRRRWVDIREVDE